MIKIICPSCHEEYDVEDDIIGAKVECSECNTSFIAYACCSQKPSCSGVEQDEEQSHCDIQAVESGHEEITVKCPYCGTGYELDSQFEGASCRCNMCNRDFVATRVQSAGTVEGRGHFCRKLKKKITIMACALTALICAAVGVAVKCSVSTPIDLPMWDDVVAWLRREAALGNTDAQFAVGTIIFSHVRSKYYPQSSGESMMRRYRKIEDSRKEVEEIEDAISWYRMAAQKEDLAAITCIGVCYYWLAEYTINDEIKISNDPLENVIAGKRYGFEARKYLELAGLGGNYPDALYNLARNIYGYGNRRELDEIWGRTIANRDSTRAILLHRAAEKGHTLSQLFLAGCYEDGSPGFVKDQSAADMYYEEAKKSHLAYAKGNYAFYEFDNSWGYGDKTSAEIEDAESVRRTRIKAEAGDAGSQYAIGKCYLEGADREEKTGLKDDHAEAVRWFRKAADQGLPVAQYKLGRCYYYGDGLKQDVSEAFKWFYKAAHQGNKAAQKYLGICYYAGLGVERDEQAAIKWLRKGVTRQTSCLIDFAYYEFFWRADE